MKETKMKIKNNIDKLEIAWGVIANAHNGDWSKASKEWREAAENFRDNIWHKSLNEYSKNKEKTQIHLSSPIKIDLITYEIGGIPDNSIINGYLFASRGNEHLIYVAKNTFVKEDGFIDKGVGSLSICKKQGNKFVIKHKNSSKGWRNFGDDGFCLFFNGFVLGLLDYPHFIIHQNFIAKYSDKEIMNACRKIDKIEDKIAKESFRKYKKENR